MKPELLHVVAVVSNPIRWESRLRLYRLFEEQMLDAGVRLTTVECAYGDRPWEIQARDGMNLVQVRSKTLVWNKENLINIGVSRLPSDWKYVAWVDADTRFRKSSWAVETVHALQQYSVVQPWETAYDLGPNDEHLQTHKSFLSRWWLGEPVVKVGSQPMWSWENGPYDFPHPGFAWACTRQAYDWLGGLFELGGMGSGDHHMALAMIGKVDYSVPSAMASAYIKHLHRWQRRAVSHLNFSLGFVPGTIEHYWHGKKVNRKYVDRWQMFIKHGFDPDEDLKRNAYGVLELAGNKPELALDLDRYFRARSEDANTLD